MHPNTQAPAANCDARICHVPKSHKVLQVTEDADFELLETLIIPLSLAIHSNAISCGDLLLEIPVLVVDPDMQGQIAKQR